MKFVFFSMRNFTRDGGGSIRMYGILNTLSEKGQEVVFVSNAKVFDKFHKDIKHLPIDCEMTPAQKAIFQGLLGILPSSLVFYLYKNIFLKIIAGFDYEIKADNIFFFEYLDTSIGYVLKRLGYIKAYTNDIHGIATMEFHYQKNQAKSLHKKALFTAKHWIADRLDKKVMEGAKAIIYASKQMEQFFIKRYSGLKNNESYILPYALGREACERKVDVARKNQLLEKYDLKGENFVVFFAGGYKPTAGIEDLIQVISKLIVKYPEREVKLFLIGTGPTYSACRQLVEKLDLLDSVIFVEKVPYHHLRTYQDLANLIVNPDRQNDYSDLIVHLKYFDALASGKLVLNSRFKSVMEINPDDKLSLTFEPSNLIELTLSIENVLLNFESLSVKYKPTQHYIREHLTYDSMIDRLLK